MSTLSGLIQPRRRSRRLIGRMRQIIEHYLAECRPLVEERKEQRTNLSVPVLLVPVCRGDFLVEAVFPAVTKDMSPTGLSLLCTQPLDCGNELLVGTEFGTDLVFAAGQVVHCELVGEGFWQIGVELSDVVDRDRYPQLTNLRL